MIYNPFHEPESLSPGHRLMQWTELLATIVCALVVGLVVAGGVIVTVLPAFIMRDWRHFQRVKNEIVGSECEAVELYPAESRLTDTTNKYWLWAVADPTFRFPIGYTTRDVRYESGPTPGLRQRRLEPILRTDED
jgi:hypothetical protein